MFVWVGIVVICFIVVFIFNQLKNKNEDRDVVLGQLILKYEDLFLRFFEGMKLEQMNCLMERCDFIFIKR